MKYVERPNLPRCDVRFALIAESLDSIIKRELERLGVDTYPVKSHPDINNSTCDHADISFLHLGKNQILTVSDDVVSYKDYRFDCRQIPEKVFGTYPQDIALNCAIVGNFAFCNSNFASKELKNNDFHIVDVKQGYAKCSVAVVTEKAIITEDVGIASAAENVGIDVLRIKPGGVGLKGFNYGFIGGSCGKISSDSLAFFGNIKLHPEYDRIKEFCNSHGVNAVSLSNKPLYDYGGLIPLLEERNI